MEGKERAQPRDGDDGAAKRKGDGVRLAFPEQLTSGSRRHKSYRGMYVRVSVWAGRGAVLRYLLLGCWGISTYVHTHIESLHGGLSRACQGGCLLT